jgi:teichuronic acid exporter
MGRPSVAAPPVPESISDRPTSARMALVWAYALTVGRFVTTAGVMFVLATVLTPREFGVMALAMVFVSFAQTLMQHGPAQAVIQRSEVTDRHFDAAFRATLVVGAALSLVLAAVAPLWADVNDLPGLRAICWALVPAILLHALMVVPDAILRRRMQFRRLSVRVLIAGLVSGAGGVAVAVAGYGVWALVVQQLLLTTISLVAIWTAVDWRPSRGPVAAELRDLYRYSLHSSSQFLSYFFSSRSDPLLMGAFFGPVPIGLFRLATRITDTVVEVSAGALGQVTLPHLSRVSDDRTALAARFGRMVHAGAVLSLPAFGILFASAEHLLALLGPQWADARPALLVLCGGGLFGVLATVLAPTIQAAGRPGTSAALGWAKAAVTVVALVAVGASYASAEAHVQTFAIAAVLAALEAIFVAVSAVVLFRVILHVPMTPVLLPAAPALLSGALALVVGRAVQPALEPANPLTALALTVAAATAAASGSLLLTDAEVTAAVRQVIRRPWSLAFQRRR